LREGCARVTGASRTPTGSRPSTRWRAPSLRPPPCAVSGRPPRAGPPGGDRRSTAVVDAIFYVVRTGCSWRQLPGDFTRLPHPAMSQATICWAAINTVPRRVARGDPATRQQRRTSPTTSRPSRTRSWTGGQLRAPLAGRHVVLRFMLARHAALGDLHRPAAKGEHPRVQAFRQSIRSCPHRPLSALNLTLVVWRSLPIDGCPAGAGRA
jgi:transposase